MSDATWLRAAAVLAAFAASASAQLPVPFPLEHSGNTPHPAVREFAPRATQIRALAELDSVRLTGVPSAQGPDLELMLERVDLNRLRFGLWVDGELAPDLMNGLDLSVWMGTVAGRPGSEAVVSFSNRGVRGWWNDGERLTHVLAQHDGRGDWSRSVAWVVGDDELGALRAGAPFRCETIDVTREAAPHGGGSQHAVFGGPAPSCVLRDCPVAIETDFQLNQVFGGDLGAQTAHVVSLLAASSARYEEQIDTVLTYPYVQFYTSPQDPWSAQDNGGGSIDVLFEFADAWSGNVPGGAVLGHMLSGASLGGGVAYLSGICDAAQGFSFAVSGNMDGLTPFPIAVSPLNWEFMVFTHETGHSFGSPHTHDYAPPIDTCAQGGCISNGTIMSYCHLCPGGLSNITTFFHPTVVAVMKAGAASCLPLFVGIEVDTLALLEPDVATSISATVKGTPNGPVELNFRFAPTGVFAAVPMTPQGGGVYSALLPPAPCGSAPEYFASFDETNCGAVASALVSPEVGVEVVLFADNFEVSTGWVVGAPGDNAASGIWERVAPVGTAVQPSQDVSAVGELCFVTGQHTGGGAGANDVDGGKTTLRSPAIDLVGTDARIGYWRWFSNDGGANPNVEVFTVAISNDGGQNYTTVEVVGPGGPQAGGGWYFHEFTVSDFVTPTGNVVVRFVAKDDVGALVEAAIDEFRVREVSCTLCQPNLGFGGPGTLALSVCGEPLTSGNSAVLDLSGAPAGAPLWILGSVDFNPTPLLVGNLVTNPLLIGFTAVANGQGAFAIANVPGGAPAPVTLYLQAAAIDLTVPGYLAISNAVGVAFAP